MFDEIKAVLFDLDGTIYFGDKLAENSDIVVEAFREAGKRIFFMTNNSAKGRQDIYEKLVGMGLKLGCEEVYTSGYAAAYFVRSKGIKSVYVFGTESLKGELKKLGVKCSPESDTVVVGFDTEFDYNKLTDALQVALKSKTIIACNLEKNYPGEKGKRMPGCGAIAGALEGALGRSVDYVVGKPSSLLIDIICSENRLKRGELLVIGDTYESDIVMAKNCGCACVCIGEEEHADTVTVKAIGEILRLL